MRVLATAVNATALYNGGVTASIELPSITNVSFFGRIDPKWDVMADVQFTNWSTIQNLTFTRTNGMLLQSTPENFKDSWRVAVGANYYFNNEWKFRGGIAWDQTPVQDNDRTPRLPDANRTWLSLGAQYAMSPQLKFDGGFTYIWASDASSNQNEGSTAQYGLINGSYKGSATIFGLSATYSF